ncbi:MAG: hypothetical protein KAG96_04800 [Ichthyobacteriaceae bacterium]|nr:hypothetical protein [Ichthyobacteriaceae bacterium]
MKKLSLPLIAILFMFVTSCTQDLSVDLPFDINSNNIELSGTEASAKKQALDFSFDKTEVVLFFQEELAKYKDEIDKVKDFKAKDVYVQIMDINSPVKFVNPTTVEIITSKNVVAVKIELTDADELTIGKQFSLTESDLPAINSILEEKTDFKIKIKGAFNGAAIMKLKLFISGNAKIGLTN